MPAYVLLFALLAAQVEPAPAEEARIEHCVLSLIHKVDVPAREAGALVALEIVEGAVVKRGAVLAMLDDETAQAAVQIASRQLELAREQAGNDVKVRVAEAEGVVEEGEFLQGAGLEPEKEGEISQPRLRRLLLAPRQAELKTAAAAWDLKLAGLQREVRAAELAQAQTQLARRRIVSPLDGMIEQVYRHVGEWVAPGDPVARIIDLQTLNVEGYADARDYSPQTLLNRPVLVTVELPGGESAEFSSTITFVSSVVETSGQYRVRAELANRDQDGRWVLMPGLTASMVIDLTNRN